jgi:hypothetical protein
VHAVAVSSPAEWYRYRIYVPYLKLIIPKRVPREGSVLHVHLFPVDFQKNFYFYILVIKNLGLNQGSGSTTLTRRIDRLGRLSIVVDPDPVGSDGENQSGSGSRQPGSGMSPGKSDPDPEPTKNHSVSTTHWPDLRLLAGGRL